MKQSHRALGVSLAASVVSIAGAASADSALLGVGDARFARPPDSPSVVVERDDAPHGLPEDPYRSPFRLTVGPTAITAGQGIGPGLYAAVDLGSGVVGVRLAASWYRGDAADDPGSRLGTRVGIYSGELTLDLRQRAPIHLVLGVGLGAVNLGRPADTWGVAGLGRVGLEYTLGLEDADVRFGASVTGGMLGPLDDATSNAVAFATMTGTLSIGF